MMRYELLIIGAGLIIGGCAMIEGSIGTGLAIAGFSIVLGLSFPKGGKQ